MDLSDLIDRNAAFTPGKTAIRFHGQAITYAGFSARIAAMARGLKALLGVGRGDRVAILAANHPDYLVLLSWHYMEPIVQRVRSEGVKSTLLTALPEFAILDA